MISIQIILPDGTVYHEKADEIKILLEDGWMGIREKHSPLIAKLADGEVQITYQQTKKTYRLTEAFFRILENEALILTETWDGVLVTL